MDKQKIFTSGYVRKLKEEAHNGISLKFYEESEFIIDYEKLLMMPNIYEPDNLSGKMRINDDLSSAIEIYEAFEELTPLQASDERLWTYLSHNDLFNYLQNRWDGEKTSNYVLDHWFIRGVSQNNLLADNLSGMWWAVHMSIDEDRIDKYELTKILFRQRDFAFRTLGTYKLGRHKEAVKGILEFIQENEKLFSTKFEDKSREVTRFLNSYGGTKPIPFFRKNDIKQLLESNIEIIEKVI
jgi:hypothetical protein